ncbi:cytochrome b/b6 domain-containing protein [Candidatus Pelagibacter sp.]|nr:cytochrome b/b6 domain-containing protein [Candidatus Pelagibacter sp.]
MHYKNTITKYGLISKIFHWLSASLLIVQIPLGFYLVDLDFGDERLKIEKIHVIIGLAIFYLIILRLLNNFFNPTPKIGPSKFLGQKLLAKTNHLLLYVAILSITVSGILKKLFNGETLNLFFREIALKENFELADQFYDIHVFSNYSVVILVTIHILAVIFHKVFFNENLIKKIL